MSFFFPSFFFFIFHCRVLLYIYLYTSISVACLVAAVLPVSECALFLFFFFISLHFRVLCLCCWTYFISAVVLLVIQGPRTCERCSRSAEVRGGRMNYCWTHAFSFSLPIQAKKKRKREKAVKTCIVCFHHHSPALQSVGQSHVMLRAPIQRCTSRREKRGQKRSISGSNERGLKRAKRNYLLFFFSFYI